MVHMSFLQEYVASHLGCDIGKYYQISTDYHAYKDIFDNKIEKLSFLSPMDRYTYMPDMVYGMSDALDGKFDQDLQDFFKGKETAFFSGYFISVVAPMLHAFNTWKKIRTIAVDGIMAGDWALAVTQWMQRRTI